MAQASLHQAFNGEAAFAAPDYRALFEHAPGLFVVFDPGFTVVAVSDVYCRVAGVARDTIVGQRAVDVVGGGDDLRASLIAVLQKRAPHAMAVNAFAIAPQASNGTSASHECQWRRVNTPVLDGAGEVCWIIHSFEDLSETMRLP